MLAISSKYPYILMTFGWFKNNWILSSRMNCSVISYSLSRLFWIILMAQTKLVIFSLTKNTFPYFPWPSYLIFSKSEMENVLYFFFNVKFFAQSAYPGSIVLFRMFILDLYKVMALTAFVFKWLSYLYFFLKLAYRYFPAASIFSNNRLALWAILSDVYCSKSGNMFP